MALSYTRLFCRRGLKLQPFETLYTCSPRYITASKPLFIGSADCETHDEKNMRLQRPMSPHLSIYQIQLTSTLSITHRTTGMILSSYAMLLGLGTLFIPGGIPCLIEMITDLNMPMPILFAAKTVLALPVTFHTFNGLRHLAWDLGLLLNIKDVYSSGYFVVAISAITAVVLAAM